jgi:hypothetical protein
MKNIKRLFLLATLIIIAITIFSSDFEKTNSNQQHKVSIAIK